MAATYLCGPANSAADLEALKAAEEGLRAAGIHPCYGPHDGGVLTSADPSERGKARLRHMLACDTVALMPGWGSDDVCELEVYVAKRLGMRCVDRAVLIAAQV